MATAKTGDTVAVNYTGKLDDGTVFDTSSGREPLEFTIGSGQVIPGFEEAVIGMSPGDKKTASLAPEQAYGARHEELVITLGRDQVPEGMPITVGQRLSLRSPDNRELPVVVTEVAEDTITLDANHPLAGKTLHFDIELVAIR